MSFIGNLFWFILGGFIMGILYILIGLIYCVTIIGIPFGYQLMKIGLFVFHPFGRNADFRVNQPDIIRIIFNIIWILFGGVQLAIMHCIFGLICFITIIGIPFGIQHFKIARMTILPFGTSGMKN